MGSLPICFFTYRAHATPLRVERADVLRFSPLMSFPKPMEEETFSSLPLDFSFITSSSLDTSPGEPIFFFFLFLWRGGSFLGKANMGKMTRSMATEHKRKPLHLTGRDSGLGQLRTDSSTHGRRDRAIKHACACTFTSCQQSGGHSDRC